MQTTIVTLAEVANQFQLWRDNKRNSKFSPIPTDLKDQARQLLTSYSISQIAAALNISRSILYYIKKDKNCSIVSTNQQTSGIESLDFIPVNFTDLNQTVKNQSINSAPPLNFTCEMIKPDGTKLIIQAADPTLIIQAFLCCS